MHVLSLYKSYRYICMSTFTTFLSSFSVSLFLLCPPVPFSFLYFFCRILFLKEFQKKYFCVCVCVCTHIKYTVPTSAQLT